MNNRKHSIAIPIILSLLLIISGALISGFSLATIGFDMNRLNTGTYSERSCSTTDDFHSIRMRVGTADIRFERSADSTCLVEIYDHDKVDYDIDVKDGTLVIEAQDHSQWYEHIGFFTRVPMVTVFLPKDRFDALSIRSVTGDVDISSLRVDGGIELFTGSGDTRLAALTCETLTSDGNTGDIVMKDVIASGDLMITRNTGDVVFDGCDAATLTIETNTGDVTGTLLSDKSFHTVTSTGDVEVPATSGGNCDITTSTGDIELRIR